MPSRCQTISINVFSHAFCQFRLFLIFYASFEMAVGLRFLSSMLNSDVFFYQVIYICVFILQAKPMCVIMWAVAEMIDSTMWPWNSR